MTVHVDRSLRLPDGEYFAEPQAKSGIAIHHTVCDSAHTTLTLWKKDKTPGGGPSHVATAYVIEHDGAIYEAFDPAAWAWQFGLPWRDALRIPFEKRFIGIELSSEGGLTEHEGRLYAFDRFNKLYQRQPAEALACATPYRGYCWFDRYEPAQLTALGRLVDDLCTRFDIPRAHRDKPFLYYGRALASFSGVIGHAMVRPDKSDPAPDPKLWETLHELAGLVPVPVRMSAGPAGRLMLRRERSTLVRQNVRRLDGMDVAAGSMVMDLLMELAKHDVYLKLETPAPKARTVGYSVLEGDASCVMPIAIALGFQSVANGRLVVRDG